MTTAAYSLESRWDIPAYVWPAVLGVSVGLHLAVLVYGIPVPPWNIDEPAIEPETEIIIETGGPLFEEVAVVAPELQEAAEVDTAEIAAPVEPAETQVLPADVSELQPLDSTPLQQSAAAVEEPQSVDVPLLQNVAPADTAIVEAQEVTVLQAEEAPAVEVPSVDLLPAEPVEVMPSDQVPSPETTVPDQGTATVTLPQTSAIVPLVTQEPAVTTVIAEDTATVLPGPAETGVLLLPDVQQVEAVTDVDPGTEQVPLEDNVSVPLDADMPVAEIVSGSQSEPVTASSTVPDITNVGPADTAPVVSSRTDVTTVLEPDTTVELAPVETTELQSVSPDVQEVAEVEQAETEVATLSPAEPAVSAVPSVEAPPEPADIVPPVEVATIDPLADVTNYVRNYDFGDCAHLTVLSAGADSAKVTAFGSGIGPFAVFDQRFASDQGYEATIELRIVTRQQCTLLDALGISGGVEAAGLVELDKTLVRSGSLVTGVIQRDLPYARIAAAQQAGLDLGGKGPPELYLIDDAGRIHDGRDYLLPASSAQTAGAWRFRVPVYLTTSVDEETALVLAVWNRPESRQPPRFGTLPASRIAGILAEPGVYSLSAFKVSR